MYELSYVRSSVMGMDVSRGLPVGLAELAPGPELAAVLASVDRSRVGADELHDLCQARQRLLAHVQ